MKKVQLFALSVVFFYSIILVSNTVPVSADGSEGNPYFSTTKVMEDIYDTGGCYLEGWPDRVTPLQTIINSDGTISVLNTAMNKSTAVVYEYDKNAKYVKAVFLETDFSKVGAFTKDKEGNYYVVFGNNVAEGAFNDYSISLVKYDTDGKELNSYQLQAQTYDERWASGYSGIWKPFDFGTCRLEISGDMIAAYFARVMFKAPDGNNHQASYGFILNKDTLARLSGKGASTLVMPSAGHSLNQFILPIDNGFMFVDQGDFNPRSFAFEKVTNGYNWKTNSFSFKQGTVYQYTYSDLGGLSKNSAGYIFAGTYENTTSFVDDGVNGSRNLFIITMNQELSAVSDPIYITDYSDKDTETAVHPKLVQIGDNKYLLLWEKYNTKTDVQTAYMVTIDENGLLLDQPMELPNTILSANDIIRYNPNTGLVHWSVSKGSDTVILYSLDVNKQITSSVSSDPDFVIRNDVLVKYLGKNDKVVIPNGVTEISAYAFYDSSNVKSVIIPNSVQKIAESSFYGIDQSAIICGKTGSIAQAHAEEYWYTFIDPDIPPSIQGVSNSKYYNSSVTITFNVGEAKLNKKSFNSGSEVSKNGSYELIVNNGFNASTTIKFVIDKTAPVIVLKDNNNVKLKNGTATNKSIKLTYIESNYKSVYVTKDKKAISYPVDGLFKATGKYVVTVTDMGGNISKVSFVIRR